MTAPPQSLSQLHSEEREGKKRAVEPLSISILRKCINLEFYLPRARQTDFGRIVEIISS